MIKLTHLRYATDPKGTVGLASTEVIFMEPSAAKFMASDEKYGTFICYGWKPDSSPFGIFVKQTLEEIECLMK